MNEQAREVFLCPNCGGPSMATGDGDAACPDCGHTFALPEGAKRKAEALTALFPKVKSSAIQRNVVSRAKSGPASASFGNQEPAQNNKSPVLAKADMGQLQEERRKRRRKLKKRSKRPARVYLGWFVIWLLAVAVVLVAVSQLQKEAAKGKGSALTVEERLGGEEREFYRREYPRILAEFNGFIRSRTTNEMSDHTRPTHQLDRKMVRYFKEHTPRRPTSGLKKNPVFWNVAFEESPGFVEVVWDGKEEGFFEGVFVKDGEDWLLDWEQFARYSSENWTLFHQKIGSQKKGVFRVYVEKVSEGENSDFEPWMKVKLAPPYDDGERRRLEETEPILLDPEGGMVAPFSDLFADLSGRSEGFSRLWERDSVNSRRAIVELEWVKDANSGEERMVIRDILAENWRTLEPEKEEPIPENDRNDENNNE